MSPRSRSSSKTAFEIVSGGSIAPFSVGLNARTLLVNIAAAADIVTETLFINVFACAFGVNVEKQV